MENRRAHPHLAEVTPSVLAALGVPDMARTLELPDVSRACVLLVDGLGWRLLAEYAADAPTLDRLRRGPLDVGYPSTTAAGLAAIGTGVPAGQHGMVGYTFEVPGVDVLNAVRWCAHPDGRDLSEELVPDELQPLVTTFTRAAEHGLDVSVVSDARFATTALTRAVLRGGRYVGVHALGDLAARASRALRREGSFCYAYHSELDLLGHIYGPGSPEWRGQLRHVDRLVESLLADLPQDGLLAVVADHGMVELGGAALDVDATPELRSGVRAIGGEVRARHVYADRGAEDDVLQAWRETLGDRAWVVAREQAIEAGWFGSTVDDRVAGRIGDVVAAARGDFGILRRTAEPGESALLGHHGSHTDAERLVPLALAHG